MRQLRIKQDALMMEHNLPGILTSNSQFLGLPDGLLAKANEVRSSGGGEALMSSLSLIETLRTDTDAILKQVKQMLADEAAVDDEAFNEFGASQWNRPRSASLNKSLLQALESYRTSYATAQQSDSQLQNQLDDAIVGITALGSSQAELEASIPASSAISTGRGDSRFADKLRSILQETEGFDELRTGTVAEVQAFCTGDVVEEEFKGALEGAEESRVLEYVSERVERILTPFESSLKDVEAYQLSKLEELRSAAQLYASSFASQADCMQEREVALQTLENAYRTFQTLSAHVAEAIHFYSGLLNLAERLRENARDFVVSRELEMKEMKTALLEKIANAANSRGPMGGYGVPSQQQQQQPFYNQPPMQSYYSAQPPVASYSQQPTPQYSQPRPPQQQQWSPGMPVQYTGEGSSGAGSSRSAAASTSAFPGAAYAASSYPGQASYGSSGNVGGTYGSSGNVAGGYGATGGYAASNNAYGNNLPSQQFYSNQPTSYSGQPGYGQPGQAPPYHQNQPQQQPPYHPNQQQMPPLQPPQQPPNFQFQPRY